MWLKCAVVSAAVITALSAQSTQSWEVSPYAGYLRLSKKPLGSSNTTSPNDNDTRLTARQPDYGLRLTLNTAGYYGVEVGASRSRARIAAQLLPATGGANVLETGNINATQVYLNGICYFMPRGEKWRPFVTAGGQVQFWSKPGLPDWVAGSSKNLGFNYGGGIKLRLMKRLYFYIEARDIWAGSPYGLDYANDAQGNPRSPGLFRQQEGSAGFAITF